MASQNRPLRHPDKKYRLNVKPLITTTALINIGRWEEKLTGQGLGKSESDTGLVAGVPELHSSLSIDVANRKVSIMPDGEDVGDDCTPFSIDAVLVFFESRLRCVADISPRFRSSDTCHKLLCETWKKLARQCTTQLWTKNWDCYD